MPLSTLEVHPSGLKVSASHSLQRPSLVFGTTSSVFADFLNQIAFVGLWHRLIRDLRVIILQVTQCRSRNLFRKNCTSPAVIDLKKQELFKLVIQA